MQQRWIQQFHHVLNFSIQLQHVTLSYYICQYRQEVISSIQPPCDEGNKQWWTNHTFFLVSSLESKALFCCLSDQCLYCSAIFCNQRVAKRMSSVTQWTGDQHPHDPILPTNTNLTTCALKHARERKDWAQLGIHSTGQLPEGCCAQRLAWSPLISITG